MGTSAMTCKHLFLDWGGTLMAEDGPAERPMIDWPTLTVLPGTREALVALAAGRPLSLCTNAAISTRTQIEQVLARVDLLRFFTHIFCASEIGARKDSPLFWDTVFSQVAQPRSQTLMVGDSLEQDVLGPIALGIPAIWFNPKGLSVPSGLPASRVIRDLRELVRLL